CARAASGHAAAPPRRVMNARRLNSSNRIRSPPARAGLQDIELAIASQRGYTRLFALGTLGGGLFPASGSRFETKLLSVCFFKQAQGLFHVVGLLPQGFRIPFASLGSKEIASVNMDGAGQT